MDRILSPKYQTSVIFGLFFQMALVICGHFSPGVAQFFGLFGVTISLLTGVVYAVGAPKVSLWERAAGGALIGGGTALVAIIASVQFGDVPLEILLIGTLASGATGAIGGMIGREWSQEVTA
jgi:hypothetical protein